MPSMRKTPPNDPIQLTAQGRNDRYGEIDEYLSEAGEEKKSLP